MSEAVEAEYVPDGNENYELVVKVSTASTLIDKTRFNARLRQPGRWMLPSVFKHNYQRSPCVCDW